jgi:amidase
MILFEYTAYDALGLAELIKTGSVSPEEVLSAAIANIEEKNPVYHAVVRTLYDEARQQLDNLDLSLPLAGVPILLKDLMCDYKGIPTASGSRWTKTWPAASHGPLVQAYLSAGLIIIGKTAVPEFGLGAVTEPAAFPHPQNPVAPHLTPGGSSGGAAVAVATRMVPLAHANDGGGSIRIPAACCGLFGLKPTTGRVLAGSTLWARRWNGLIVDHVLTRSVRDSACLLDLTQDPETRPYLPQPEDSYLKALTRPLKSLKIGRLATPVFGQFPIAKECGLALDSATQHLHALRHTCIDITLNIDSAALRKAYSVLVASELSQMMKIVTQQIGSPPLKGDIELASHFIAEFGRFYTASDYLDAVHSTQQAKTAMNDVFNSVDMIMTPTLARAPVPQGYFQPSAMEMLILKVIGWLKAKKGFLFVEAALTKKLFDYVAFTPLCNMTGHPAMSLPLYRTQQEGVPIGIDIMGQFGDEERLLQLAFQLEPVMIH